MKFRLKMDLSQFYDDERNLAYILVDPKWNQVICLQEHVQKLFDVEEVQFLTDDGIYIPPRESIDVIKSNDVLRAIIPQKSKKKKKKSKSNGFGGGGDATAPNEVSLEIKIKDKRKTRDNDDEEGLLTCSTPNLRPKKKQKTSLKKEQSVNSSIISSIMIKDQSSIKELEESCIEALQNSNTVTSTMDSKELNKSNEVLAHPEDVSEDTVKSRKRKRSRKNKKSVKNQEKDEKQSRLSSVPIPISSSTLRLSKSMSTPPNQSIKHVHFSGDDADDGQTTLVDEESHPTKSKEGRVIYRNLLNINCEARIIEPQAPAAEEDTLLALKKENLSHQLTKPIILIQEDIILVPAPETGIKKASLTFPIIKQNDDEENCSVIEVDDSVVMMKSLEEPENENDDAANDSSCFADINVEKILPLSEELSEELPNVGDVILFKMYQLSEACTPEISKYICGRCEQIDSTNKTLNCLVLDGLDQLDENLARLTPSDENQVKKRKGQINCFQFFLNEMLDKRVFRM